MSETANDATPSGGDRPVHGRWPMVLVVVATLIAIVSALTTWVQTQALDTDEWVDASTEVLANDDVQAALATYLVDELYSAGDVAGALNMALPDALDGLAGPLAGAMREPLTEGVERLLDRPRIQQAWETANRLAHEKLVAIVRDDVGDNVSTAGGAIVLDLSGVVHDVGSEIGLPDSVLDRLSDDVGQMTILESDELDNVQEVVRVMDFLSWFLFLVVVALYASAVYLARDRRRVMLRNIGIALTIAGVVLMALRTIAVRATVEAIVQIPANRSAGSYVADVYTELVVAMAWTAVIIGVFIAAFAALLGPHRWAVAVRERLARTPNPGAVIAGTTIVALLLIAWWSPGRVFERWVTGVTVLALIAGGVIALTVAVGSPSESGVGRTSASRGRSPGADAG